MFLCTVCHRYIVYREIVEEFLISNQWKEKTTPILSIGTVFDSGVTALYLVYPEVTAAELLNVEVPSQKGSEHSMN